jgi:poly(hydroxyalkanoate) granule-associated protein
MSPMPESAKRVQAELTESARRVWLAGLGAFAIAQEQGGKMIDSLIERGREFETGRMFDETRGQLVGAWNQVGGTFEAQMTGTLHRIGVPTRDEFALLARRVEELSTSLESLRPAEPARAPAPPAKAIAEKHAPAERHEAGRAGTAKPHGKPEPHRMG